MGKSTLQELRCREKALKRIIKDLKENWIFVEGQKDRKALMNLGCMKVKTISGNLRKSCMGLPEGTSKVIILTDLDRTGDALLKAAKDELESMSVKADCETRKRIAGILNLRFFETADRLFQEFEEKIKENKVI